MALNADAASSRVIERSGNVLMLLAIVVGLATGGLTAGGTRRPAGGPRP